MQFQADILDRPVVRPLIQETTALAPLTLRDWPLVFSKTLLNFSSNGPPGTDGPSDTGRQTRTHVSIMEKAVTRSFDWQD